MHMGNKLQWSRWGAERCYAMFLGFFSTRKPSLNSAVQHTYSNLHPHWGTGRIVEKERLTEGELKKRKHSASFQHSTPWEVYHQSSAPSSYSMYSTHYVLQLHFKYVWSVLHHGAKLYTVSNIFPSELWFVLHMQAYTHTHCVPVLSVLWRIMWQEYHCEVGAFFSSSFHSRRSFLHHTHGGPETVSEGVLEGGVMRVERGEECENDLYLFSMGPSHRACHPDGQVLTSL